MAIIKVKTGGITADAITDALIADDVVGTEHLTANEVDTTALKGDAVTGAELADDAVNSEHYTDGSVDTAHIADAQITTAKLSTAVFTGATDIGADLADADLILVDDGAGGTIRKAALSRVKTYAGGANTPAFEAYLAATQVIAQTTNVKITMNTERFDTAGEYDHSTNYRFTPQTAGKYFVYSHLNLQTAGTKVGNAISKIYKNGSVYTQSASNYATDTTSTVAIGITNIIAMNGNDDYLEVYAYMESFDNAERRITPEVKGSYFGAFLILE